MGKNDIIELTNRLYRLTLLFPKKEPLRYKMRETADDILANLVVWEVFHTPNPGRFTGLEEDREPAFANASAGKEIIFAVEERLEVLNSYFEVAKWQNWVSFFDILEIEKEYDKIREKIKIREKAETFENKMPKKVSKQIGTSFVNTVERRKEKEGNFHIPAEQIINETKSYPIFQRGVSERQNTQKIGQDRKAKILEILKQKEKIQVGEVSEILPDVSKRTIRRDFVQLLEQGLIERIGEKNDTFYQLKNQNT